VIAWLILLATALGGSVMVVVLATGFDLPPGDPTLPFVAILAADSVVFSAAGLFILRQRPRHPVGMLLSVAGLAIVATFSGFVYSALRTETVGPGDPLAQWAAWTANVLFNPMFLLLWATGVLFPDGRLPSARWRWPMRAAVVVVALATAVTAFAPGSMGAGLGTNPIGLGGRALADLAPFAVAAGSLVTVVGMSLAAVAVVVRFRRARGAVRAQHKWLLAAVGAIAVCLPPSFLDGPDGMSVFDILAISSLALLPLSIGVAITRSGLYEIDRLISRTIGWGVVTGLLLGVFAIALIGLQAILAPLIDNSTLAVAGSTLLAFALAQPVRARVQAVVDRRFNRSRVDAERAMDAFGARIKREVELTTLRAGLVGTVSDAVEPSATGLWIRTRSR
jgi:hypothetical protein